MKGGYVMVDGRGVNINLGSGSSGSAAGLNADLAMVVNGGKTVILHDLRWGASHLSPAAVTVYAGTSGTMVFMCGRKTVTVTTEDTYTAG